MKRRIIVAVCRANATLDAFKAHTDELAVHIAIVRADPPQHVRFTFLDRKRDSGARWSPGVDADHLLANIEVTHAASSFAN
jgi:hypothetical protein